MRRRQYRHLVKQAAGPVRPFLPDEFQRAAAHPGTPYGNRIVGLEVRLRYPTGCIEELTLIPTDIRYPGGNAAMPTVLTMTAHTARGDSARFGVVLPA